MMRNVFWLMLMVLSVSWWQPAAAAVAYYGMEPDIITNYLNNKKKLGYVRITVELMLKDDNAVEAIEHHEPLLRDAIVDMLTKEPEEKIKSLTGREEIRQKILVRLNELLKQETGQELLQDVIFTKYLYQ